MINSWKQPHGVSLEHHILEILFGREDPASSYIHPADQTVHVRHRTRLTAKSSKKQLARRFNLDGLDHLMCYSTWSFILSWPWIWWIRRHAWLITAGARSPAVSLVYKVNSKKIILLGPLCAARQIPQWEGNFLSFPRVNLYDSVGYLCTRKNKEYFEVIFLVLLKPFPVENEIAFFLHSCKNEILYRVA